MKYKLAMSDHIKASCSQLSAKVAAYCRNPNFLNSFPQKHRRANAAPVRNLAETWMLAPHNLVRPSAIPWAVGTQIDASSMLPNAGPSKSDDTHWRSVTVPTQWPQWHHRLQWTAKLHSTGNRLKRQCMHQK